MFFFPSLFFLTLFGSYYTFFKFKKCAISQSFIFSYSLTLISITAVSKLIFIFQIIDLTKQILFFIFFINILIIFKFKSELLIEFKNLINLIKKNTLNKFFFIIFLYLLIQSIQLPPSNFDSLAYHIQRNYLFINEKTMYPITNAHYANQVFLPLNSDLLFFFHAIFKSNFFMNIFSFFSYVTILFLLNEITKILNLNKNVILSTYFIFFSFSCFTLSLLSTKNDIILSTITLCVVYFFYSFIKTGDKFRFLIFIICIFYLAGIKWNTIFFITICSPFFLYYILKSKNFLIGLKLFIYSLPIIILIGPFEILYYNYFQNFDHIAGPTEFILGHSNPNGFSGMFSNFIRILVLLFDVTIPINYLNFEFLNNFFNQLTNNILNFLFNDNKLGIATNLKWLEFDYGYSLKPHSDYTAYSITGFVVTIFSFYYLLFGKNKYLKYLSVVSIINIFLICYFLTWQPWISRFLMLNIALNLIIFTDLLKKLNYKFLSYLNLFCAIIFLFNIFSNISQPLIKHSQTSSWLISFLDRESYQAFSIPDLSKINNTIKHIPDQKKIVVVVEKEGSQTPYEFLRLTNSYYLFVDKEFNNFFQSEYLGKKQKINISKFDYVLNLSNNSIYVNNFDKILNLNEQNFELFKQL